MHKEDKLHTKENYNINIAKLKKTFKASYLLELLSSPDNFIKHIDSQKQVFQNLQVKKTVNQQQEQSKAGMVVIKLQLASFLSHVHILSEKGSI